MQYVLSVENPMDERYVHGCRLTDPKQALEIVRKFAEALPEHVDPEIAEYPCGTIELVAKRAARTTHDDLWTFTVTPIPDECHDTWEKLVIFNSGGAEDGGN